ncbi:hypothetical protein [Vulcanisaeta thermophila]|uniref:hypothetical protein n=1 Tax=Vulcanisaeta thermophila TaxID=867917 RepID=UPI0008532937|nr:hypothetical protein [Vulcanisaeta thermophila]
MSKRQGRRKKEAEEGQESASITAFLYGTTETKPETKPQSQERVGTTTEAKPIEKPTGATQAVPGEDAVLNFIKARGNVTKNELMAWAKTKGLRTSDVLRAIEELTSRGRITRRLNDKGDLVYVFIK